MKTGPSPCSIKSLVELIQPNQGERLLLIDDLYEITVIRMALREKPLPLKDKPLTFAYFIFFEGLIDCKGNHYFLKENIDSFIDNIVSTLLEIHGSLHDYVLNYLSQQKIKKIDEKIAVYIIFKWEITIFSLVIMSLLLITSLYN